MTTEQFNQFLSNYQNLQEQLNETIKHLNDGQFSETVWAGLIGTIIGSFLSIITTVVFEHYKYSREMRHKKAAIKNLEHTSYSLAKYLKGCIIELRKYNSNNESKNDGTEKTLDSEVFIVSLKKIEEISEELWVRYLEMDENPQLYIELNIKTTHILNYINFLLEHWQFIPYDNIDNLDNHITELLQIIDKFSINKIS